jgi:hypothetical protein
MTRPSHLRVLHSCSLLLGVLQLAVLLVTFESRRKPMSIPVPASFSFKLPAPCLPARFTTCAIV